MRRHRDIRATLKVNLARWWPGRAFSRLFSQPAGQAFQAVLTESARSSINPIRWQTPSDVQPQDHRQILCKIIDFGMNLEEAGDAKDGVYIGASESRKDGQAAGY